MMRPPSLVETTMNESFAAEMFLFVSYHCLSSPLITALLAPRRNLTLLKSSILELLACNLDRVGGCKRHRSACVNLQGITPCQPTAENEKDARRFVRPVVPAVDCSTLNAYVSSLESQFYAVVEVAVVEFSKITVEWHQSRLTTLFRLDGRCRNRETRCDEIATQRDVSCRARRNSEIHSEYRLSVRLKVDASQDDAILVGQALGAIGDGILPAVIRHRKAVRLIQDGEVAVGRDRLAGDLLVVDEDGLTIIVMAGNDAARMREERHGESIRVYSWVMMLMKVTTLLKPLPAINVYERGSTCRARLHL
jgi:hypothetical protein